MATLPASITITQGIVIPAVTIAVGNIPAPPSGIPPYPLVTDPTQTWWLTYVNGTLAWVEQTQAPDVSAFELEDAGGVVLLEDGLGVVELES